MQSAPRCHLGVLEPGGAKSLATIKEKEPSCTKRQTFGSEDGGISCPSCTLGFPHTAVGTLSLDDFDHGENDFS